MVQVCSQRVGDLVGEDPDLHDQSRPAQTLEAPTGDLGVRISDAHDDTGHVGTDDGVGARGRPALVVAGLERRVHGGAGRSRPGLGQRHALGMGPARRLGRS